VLASRTEIRFWYRGALVALTGVPVQKTVLRWLRDQGATGTKEGCGEGDCGACTVVVGTLDPGAPQGLALRAVNSCLLFVPALDGRALFTVEDVASGPDLHPVQRALVDLHASQCGFCTPGFTMSLWADYQDRATAPDRAHTEAVLSGNLCRCTGYRPLIDAAQAAWSHPVVKFDRAPVAAALATVAALPALEYAHGGRSWSAPTTLDALAAAAEQRPQARLIAGATDLALKVTKGLQDLGDLVSVSQVAELKRVYEEDGTLVIGAGVDLATAFEALGPRNPALEDLGRWFASTPVKNAGTLGGNVMNGSPIGDSMPALLVLGTVLELRLGGETRRLPLDEFYLGYQKTARRPGEILVALEVPVPTASTLFRTWKVSKRRDQDISAVCGAFALSFTAGTVTAARVAFGGMAAVPARAPRTEEALAGRPFDVEALEAARQSLGQDFAPLTDGRATADYRRRVAANLLTRLHGEAQEVPQ